MKKIVIKGKWGQKIDHDSIQSNWSSSTIVRRLEGGRERNLTEDLGRLYQDGRFHLYLRRGRVLVGLGTGEGPYFSISKTGARLALKFMETICAKSSWSNIGRSFTLRAHGSYGEKDQWVTILIRGGGMVWVCAPCGERIELSRITLRGALRKVGSLE